jgi:hypothetical protein
MRGVVVVLSISVVLAACSKEAIWSIRVVSPNGQWIAGARTDMWDGLGVGAAEALPTESR